MMLADSFHETMADAMREASHRRSNPIFREFLTKVEPSRYGGYRVRSYPADLFIDQLADGPNGGPFMPVRHLLEA